VLTSSGGVAPCPQAGWDELSSTSISRRSRSVYFGGRPRRMGVFTIHSSTSVAHQIGPIASFAAGGGKSGRAVYRVAVRLLTCRSAAISESPTMGSPPESTPRPYDELTEVSQRGHNVSII
jgi:hypothetical protein